MVDIGDCLIEAVKNSEEAGATFVDIKIEIKGTRCSLTITDDGRWKEVIDPFKAGSTTKGEGRGIGLSLIKEIDREARLLRLNDKTVLSFSALKDESIDKIEESLFPIFQSNCLINVVVNEDNRAFTLNSDELEDTGAIPVSGRGIALFKALVRFKRSSKNG